MKEDISRQDSTKFADISTAVCGFAYATDDEARTIHWECVQKIMRASEPPKLSCRQMRAVLLGGVKDYGLNFFDRAKSFIDKTNEIQFGRCTSALAETVSLVASAFIRAEDNKNRIFGRDVICDRHQLEQLRNKIASYFDDLVVEIKTGELSIRTFRRCLNDYLHVDPENYSDERRVARANLINAAQARPDFLKEITRELVQRITASSGSQFRDRDCRRSMQAITLLASVSTSSMISRDDCNEIAKVVQMKCFSENTQNMASILIKKLDDEGLVCPSPKNGTRTAAKPNSQKSVPAPVFV